MTKSTHRADLDGDCWADMKLNEHTFSEREGGGPPKWMLFGCRKDPRVTCEIALRPLQKNEGGASWEWDGNRAAPTINPSVNCEKACGWHGWIKDGVWLP